MQKNEIVSTFNIDTTLDEESNFVEKPKSLLDLLKKHQQLLIEPYIELSYKWCSLSIQIGGLLGAIVAFLFDKVLKQA